MAGNLGIPGGGQRDWGDLRWLDRMASDGIVFRKVGSGPIVDLQQQPGLGMVLDAGRRMDRDRDPSITGARGYQRESTGRGGGALSFLFLTLPRMRNVPKPPAGKKGFARVTVGDLGGKEEGSRSLADTYPLLTRG
ncbi:hypothetical protein NL676_017927 [Syzygium grande]|nr:hypothetical protein NL676_017927 [Syzygium grande]